ncbi:hypothetical protein Pcinc_036462 [Petrolisthes cinctipes]|uniref:Dihydroorotate dehydrogenase (quinone), mitochondrial n=1 Tax=Petrolisthes cinctipes TaxID=88211 RepID=A0AAE1BVM6_PETCI|nr:hypothetical protein Pcinc_036462 [Petrolisthes cinctipes]
MAGRFMRYFNNKIIKKKLSDIIKVGVGGAITFVSLNIYFQNDKFYDNLVMPVFRHLDPEMAHSLAVTAAKYKLIPQFKLEESKLLGSLVFGLHFRSPFGLAAGFDKNGEAVEGLSRMGFGFVEVGSVTPQPQPGNPKPRVFRLTQDQAIINRYGFNSDGHDAVYERLSHLPPPGQRQAVLGINLGKNKTSQDALVDYTAGVHKFGPIADYLVINISSPNTPGLRDLQQRQELEKLLKGVLEARDSLPSQHKPPVLLKVAPDISDTEKQQIAIVAVNYKVDGLVVSNTTISRPAALQSPQKEETGGLSGAPLKSLATATIKDMYRLTKGSVPIIGVGGVASGQDAYEKIRAGASLIQLYTGLIYTGPQLIPRATHELEQLLRDDGFSSVAEAVGVDSKKT